MKKFNLGLLKVRTIKKICVTHSDCVLCPLFNEKKCCPFEHYFPAKWEVKING